MLAVDNDLGVKLQSSYLEYLPAIFRRELAIDTAARKVWVAGEEVGLTELEFDLLAFLYERQSKACNESEIAEAVNVQIGETGTVKEQAILQIIRDIRNKIEPDPSHPRYLKSIPGKGYRLDSDEFMGRFLLIFESIFKPIENIVNNAALYFDPLLTPEPFLPWLASWIDVVLDPTWPVEKRRELVKSAADLWKWRGTKRGLREFLRIYTGSVPEISEQISGMHLDKETRLGVNTRLGSSGAGYQFTVTLRLDEDVQVNTGKIKAIIEAEKPAYTVYTLQIEQNKPKGEDDNGA